MAASYSHSQDFVCSLGTEKSRFSLQRTDSWDTDYWWGEKSLWTHAQWENIHKRCCRAKRQRIPQQDFFHSIRVLFLTPWIKMWPKNNLWLRERGAKLLGWVVTSNSKHWLRNRLCLLKNNPRCIACGGLFFRRNMKLLLVSHLQGEGEWKMTSRSGRRSMWSPLSAAQGFMEHAVYWDLLPALGISLCATLDLDPLAWIHLFLSSGVRMKASLAHTQHYEDKDYHYIFNRKNSSSSWFQSPVRQVAIVYAIHIWLMSKKQVGHWLRVFGF